MTSGEPNSARSRIDKWLWHARFYRSRALAQQAAASGLVRLNGARVEKAGRDVKPGDVLTVPRGSDILAIRVVALASRRGSAPDARALYEILNESVLDPGPRAP
jgi:ribosome-associated heat shock protein Hsp15